MRGLGRAALGIVGHIIVTLAKKPGWKRMGAQELREAEQAREKRRKRERDAIVISILIDQGQHDLAKIMAMRAAGRTVVVGVLQEDGSVVEVIDL